jgi:hypothetical protein
MMHFFGVHVRCSRVLHSIPALVAVLCFVPFALGTSPLPPPYYRYTVSGTVTHRDGRPARDIIMVMFTRTAYDTALQISRSTLMADDRPLSVSSLNGWFVLSVRTDIAAESLAIGAIAAGRPMMRDAAFHPDTLLTNAMKEKGTTSTDVGCAGCGAEPSPYEYTVYYATSISRNVVLDE